MEKLKNIHDHKFTDLIKVCIFALMLILPGIIFLPSCLYYGFNEHATNTETTTINYKYQSNEVNTQDDIVLGNIYHWNINDASFDELINFHHDGTINIQLINIISYDFHNCFVNDEGINAVSSIDNGNLAVYLYTDSSLEGFLYFYLTDNADNDAFVEFGLDFSNTFYLNCDFVITSINDLSFYSEYLPQYTDYNVIESVSVNTDDTISNKLYKSWEQMWNTPLFSWTNNTPFNGSLNDFIGIFGINAQSYISNVLIWLLSMTAIYVVIDIVIGVFKWLTHLIGAR